MSDFENLEAKLQKYLSTFPGIRLNRIERLKSEESISFFGDLSAEEKAYLKRRAIELSAPTVALPPIEAVVEAAPIVVAPVVVEAPVIVPEIAFRSLNTLELDQKLQNYLEIWDTIRQARIQKILRQEDIPQLGPMTPAEKAYLKVQVEALQVEESAKRKAEIAGAAGKRAKQAAPKKTERTSRVYFFDVHQDHLEDVQEFCSQIRWFRPTVPPEEQVPFNVLMNELFDNPYFRFLQPAFSKEELEAKYHLVEGLTLNDEFWSQRIAELKQSADPTVLLAWNGTLTKFDELPAMPGAQDHLEHELEMLFGGKSRLLSMRLLLGRLQDDGVKPVILTDSSQCGSPHFIALLMAFSPKLEFICSGKENKGEVLKKNPAYADVCGKEERLKRAIFFDNDAQQLENVRKFCRQVELVKIPEYLQHPPKVLFTAPPFQRIIEDIGGPDNNLYFHMLVADKKNSDRLDPKSGIRPIHVKQLERWLAETADVKGRAVLFDWDRTLTVIEGFYDLLGDEDINRRLDNDELTLKQVYEDSLLYLTGGNERLRMLRDMIDNIPLDVEVIILTNNGSCIDPVLKIFFNGMISSLFSGRSYSTICGKAFMLNKGRALKAHGLFQDVCAKSHSKQELDFALSQWLPKRLASGGKDVKFPFKLSDEDQKYVLAYLEKAKAQQEQAKQEKARQEKARQEQVRQEQARQEEQQAKPEVEKPAAEGPISVVPFASHEAAAAAEHLSKHGFAVIMHPYFAQNVLELKKQFMAEMDNFPEYRPPRQVLQNKFVGGGFGALGNASSFHNPFVRKMRMWCESALAPLLQTMAAKVGKKNVEQIIDRMLFRLPKVEPMVETWHRNNTPIAAQGDHIFGGWINLDPLHHQQLSCIPGTHLPGHYVFPKFDKDTINKLNEMRHVVNIPPGGILIMYESLVHEVVKKTLDAKGKPLARSPRNWPIVRLFLAWRLTDEKDSLLDRLQQNRPSKYLSLDQLLERQGVVPLKSGKMPQMFPHMSWVNPEQREQLAEWSKITFVEEVLVSAEVQTGAQKGEVIKVVQSPMLPLADNGLPLYLPYRPFEVAILRPSSKVSLPEPGQTKGFKEVQIGAV